MELNAVVVNQDDVLGKIVNVGGHQEVRRSDYNPVDYRIFEISSRKEPSALVVVEGFSMSDIPEGRQKVVFPRGLKIEHRRLRFGSKTINEPVFVAEEMRTVKA